MTQLTEFELFQKELNKKASKFADAAKTVYSFNDNEALNKAITKNNEQYTLSELYRLLDRIFECADNEDE